MSYHLSAQDLLRAALANKTELYQALPLVQWEYVPVVRLICGYFQVSYHVAVYFPHGNEVFITKRIRTEIDSATLELFLMWLADMTSNGPPRERCHERLPSSHGEYQESKMRILEIERPKSTAAVFHSRRQLNHPGYMVFYHCSSPSFTAYARSE